MANNPVGAPKFALALQRWSTAVGAVIVVAFYLLMALSTSLKWLPTIDPRVYGLVALLAFYVVSVSVVGGLNPLGVVVGADGRLSTSKFQFFMWTAIVVFVYAWVYAVRAKSGQSGGADDFPQNVLIAMGFSVVTVAGAKGITVSYLKSGQIDKDGGPATGGLFSDDAGLPDLTKIQMLVWTFIAGAVYVFQVAHLSDAALVAKFPDIDGALMVLMGLGQGAYLGNKLVSTNTPSPTISKLSVGAGAEGTVVSIQGDDLGPTQGDSKVLFDGVPLTGLATSWDGNQVSFVVPASHPNGNAWTKPRQTVQIRLLVNGTSTLTSLPFDVT